jgi:hypothetical protein
MTARATPVSAPHGRGFYVTVAILASLFGFAFLWGSSEKASLDGVPLNTPMVWRVAAAGIAAIFLIGVMQAFERLLVPARAQARSAAISDVARVRLRGLRNVLLAMGVAASMTDFAVRTFWGGHLGYMSVLSGAFFFAGYLVVDLCGERR